MPEKRYKRGCGTNCIRCWVNNLKHGNKEAKAYLRKHPELLEDGVTLHCRKPMTFTKSEQSEIRENEKRRDTIQYEKQKYARKNRIGKKQDQKIVDWTEEEKGLDEKLSCKVEFITVGYSKF